MKLHIIPFGEPAWTLRREIIRDIIKARSGPPYDFRDVLYLVPNERTLRTLKGIFLKTLSDETSSSACIPPSFRAMNRYIASRLRPTKPLIDEMTKGLVLEEMCKKAAASLTGIETNPEVTGASLAPALAEALDMIYAYGVDDRALTGLSGDSVPLALLVRVKRRYEAWLGESGLEDPSMLKAGYMPGPSEFGGVGTVVLDGFYDAEPAELRLIKALSALPDCHIIMEAPGLSRPEAREPGMPYYGTDSLLEALGLDAGNAGSAGVEADKEASLYCGALFEGRPLNETLRMAKEAGPLVRDITVVGALNPVEEVCFVARDIKEGYLSGRIKDLDRVLVFFPELDLYLPALEEAFADAGVPYHVSQGRPLIQSPVTTALLDLIAIPSGGYSFRDMRRAFSSPLVILDEGGNRLNAFDKFARKEGITGGRGTWLRRIDAPHEAVEEARVARHALKRALGLTAPFDSPAGRLSRWVEETTRLLDASGIASSVAALGDSHAALPLALECIRSVLDGMGRAAGRVKGNIGRAEYVYLLKKSLRDRRYAPVSERVSGVRVLGRLETMSEPFDDIYAGGMVEGAVPAPKRFDLFFGEDASRRLGLPGPERLRARDARLFLSLLTGAPRVHITWPEPSGGKAACPSPYIRALGPLIKSGRIRSFSRVARTLKPGEALGPGELLRSLAMSREGNIEEALRLLPQYAPGLGMALNILSPAPAPGLPSPPAGKTQFKVTELEEYMLCHYRYYQYRVLKSAPPEDPEDDIAPREAGSIIHGILESFYKGLEGGVTVGNSQAALTRLKALAVERFGKLPGTLANSELQRRFTEFIAPRFIEAELEFRGSGFGVCATEIPVVMEVDIEGVKEGHVVITGKIDRVELDAGGNFTVVDYKTGKYPGSKNGPPLKDMFQLPLYAHMLKDNGAATMEGNAPLRPKGRLAGVVYYDLRDSGARDATTCDTYISGTSAKGRKKTPEEMDELVKGAVAKATEAVRGILSGSFEPTCDSRFVCERCIYAKVCVKGATVEDADDDEGGERGEG